MIGVKEATYSRTIFRLSAITKRNSGIPSTSPEALNFNILILQEKYREAIMERQLLFSHFHTGKSIP
jgi:hypothetical protein